jgi:hypothetical protein
MLTTEKIQKAEAEWGNVEFQLDLAGMYEQGLFGVKQDYAEAYFWYKLSGQAGLFDLWKLSGHLTHEQKVAVDKRIAEWKPTYGPLLFGPELSDRGEEDHLLFTPPAGGYIPDPKTAAQVVEAILIPIYGEKQIKSEEPFTATLEDGVVWVVRGRLPPNMVGGVAVIAIEKSSGRVIGYVHGD